MKNKYTSFGMLGKHHSEKGKQNISIAKKGIRVSKNTEFKKGNVPYNKGKHHSEETKQKIRQAIGQKKGFITPVHKIVRSSTEYKLWRTAVFERDKYRCIWCGIKSKKGTKKVVLNADHIKPFAAYPELRFAIDNGRTLCVHCHRMTDTYGGRKKTKGSL